MSPETFPLSTSPELLLALPISDALAESNELECWSYGQVFFDKGKQAENDGNTETAVAWRLLGQLCQVMVDEGNPVEPFRPMFEGPDGRSILPADLDEVSALAVQQLAAATQDTELRARLLDVTWDRLRDPDAARQAVQDYVDSANGLFDPSHWIAYVQRIERALRLASQLRDKKLVECVLAEIERRIMELDGSDPLYMTSRLMELLYDFEVGEPDVMGTIATQAARSAEEGKDFERARAHLENLARWRRRAKDQDGERNAKIEIASSYVSQADLHSDDEGALAAAHFLEQAHEAYRNIPRMRDTAAEVYERLREAQRRARDSLQTITTEGFDLSPAIKAARERVAGRPFREALLAVATTTQPTNFDREAETARELMSKFPFQNLMGGVKIDDDGRIIARKTTAITSDEKDAEQALWERVVEQVTMGYQVSVQAEIYPAMNQLTFEHSPLLRDFKDLVVNNPFVPPGREELFAKGFLAGFRWNFPEALSILVPQLENSLRHLLAQTGAEVTRRDKHGLQTVIQLGTILSDRTAELEPILGMDLIKELKVLFTDQHGPDLRNQIAHGLMSHDEYFGSGAIYAWWLIFLLCINPVHRRFRADAPTEGKEASIEESPDR